MLNNRQNGRRRGRGRTPNTGGQRGNESRIDSRARGNAPQMLEKYKNMARDAQMSGDRVMTEYYMQFADHYFRIVAESRSRMEEQQQRRPQGDWQDEGDEGDDTQMRGQEDSLDDDADEAPRDRGRNRDDVRGEYRNEGRNEGRNDGRNDPRSGGRQDNRPESRGDNRNDGRNDNRGDHRSDGRSDNRSEGRAEPRGANRNDPRADRSGETRPERPRREPRAPRPRGDDVDGNVFEQPVGVADGVADGVSSITAGIDIAVLPPALGVMADPIRDLDEEPAPAPRKRGRPRKVAVEDVPAEG